AVGSRLWIFGGLRGGECLGDLHHFDAPSSAWTDLTREMRGAVPSGRAHMGLASSQAGGLLFLLGGECGATPFDELLQLDLDTLVWTLLQRSGEGRGLVSFPGLVSLGGSLVSFGGRVGGTGASYVSNDLFLVPATQEPPFPGREFELGFARFFEGDVAVLPGGASGALLDRDLNMCTSVFPCALTIRGGSGGGLLRRRGNASVTCKSEDGCQSLALSNLTIEGEEESTSSVPLLRFVGETSLRISDVTLRDVGCTDAVVSLDKGSMSIQRSRFSRVLSSSAAGTITLVDAAVTVTGTVFEGCSGPVFAATASTVRFDDVAFHGGGALGTRGGGALHLQRQSHAAVVNSRFRAIASAGSGGAIVSVESSLRVSNSDFGGCSSRGAGGAILVLDLLEGGAETRIESTRFADCSSVTRGGAIVAQGFSRLSISNSSFQASATRSKGDGGAVSVMGSTLTVDSSAFVQCTADASGGARV
ncbi:hypothetical protein T484DRAFT_1772987, partial [Baffinella frigidus]